MVKVTDASGNVVVETTAYWDSINKYSATYVVCSTPNLTSGSSYSLYVNGTQKATASAQRTSGGYGVMSLGETAASNESAVALAAEVTTLTLNVTQAEKPEVVLTNKYTSEKPEIVAVSETGLVIGMEEGTALVTAVIYANDTAVLTQNYEITVEGKDVVVDDTDMPFVIIVRQSGVRLNGRDEVFILPLPYAISCRNPDHISQSDFMIF